MIPPGEENSEPGTKLADRVTEAAVLALTALGWAVLAYVVAVLPVSPSTQAVFYTAGFVALAGSAALTYELYLWRTTRHRRPAISLLGTGMRFALAVEFALWLQSIRALTAWYLVLLVGAFLFLEFLSRQVAADDRERRRG